MRRRHWQVRCIRLWRYQKVGAEQLRPLANGRQYSRGSSRQVLERSASVMTQILAPGFPRR